MKLGGTIFVRNGLQYDYCFVEAINSLKEFCDEVVVLDAGSDDGTKEVVEKMADSKTKIVCLEKEEWEQQKGKEKLAYFTNRAIDHLTAEWNFNLQADEIVHEKSYKPIRNAINSNYADGYMVTRVNLWGSPYMQLNVPQSRLPCSSQVIRLTKSNCQSVGDGESLDCQVVFNFVKDIKIYHMGFVREREVMKSKIINMQEAVFGVSHDTKLDVSDIFQPELWFDKEDLKPIDEPLPKIIQQWAKERVYKG